METGIPVHHLPVASADHGVWSNVDSLFQLRPQDKLAFLQKRLYLFGAFFMYPDHSD